MIIDVWATTQKLMEETGLSADQILRMDMSEYGRLTARQSPAQAAIQALDAEYGAPSPQVPQQPHAPGQEPQQPPQGIDLADMTMEQYAQIRAQLGVQGGEYGRGALDGGSTADWVQRRPAQGGQVGMAGRQRREPRGSRPLRQPRRAARQPDSGAAVQHPGNAFNL